MQPAYVTILARNYLPRALMLAESLAVHGGDTPLTIFLTDARPDTELPGVPHVRWMRPADLDLPARDLLDLAMSYDLVEFATAVKPLVLQALLREHPHVAYVDPDTYAMSPMVELVPALEDGSGVVLTPHYLEPNISGNRFTEGHLLHVGVFNLGFCAVDRKAGPFLDWWWGHLRTECLHGPLDGLFTDQKWMDVGAVLFDATALRHYGYNISVANLHERPIARDADGWYIASRGDRLRLLHFHAFDPRNPRALYGRVSSATEETRGADTSIDELAEDYAAGLLRKMDDLGAPPAYGYAADTTGRPISRHMRHAYRAAVIAAPGSLPSPFVPEEAAAYERWRRGARATAGRLVLSDLAKGVRCALPDEYDAVKRRFPRLMRALRGRYLQDAGMWS